MNAQAEDVGAILEVLVTASRAALAAGAFGGVLDALAGLVEQHQPERDDSDQVRVATEELIQQLHGLLDRIDQLNQSR